LYSQPDAEFRTKIYILEGSGFAVLIWYSILQGMGMGIGMGMRLAECAPIYAGRRKEKHPRAAAG
jgi:hypothetical protein